MKKQFHYLILSFLFFSALSEITLAQSSAMLGKFEDPSPKKMNPEIGTLGTYSGDNSVDLYTGRINVQIPLYTIEAKDIKLPISLSYNQDGIKVNTKASWVGLGFNLDYASYIQRERKGSADELPTGRFSTIGSYFPLEVGGTMNGMIKKFVNRPYSFNPSLYVSYANAQFWAEYDASNFLLDGISEWSPGSRYFVDSEPDIFTFNFLGNQGSFVLDELGDARIISGNPAIKITPPIGPKGYGDSWIVMLPDGVQLKFPNNSLYSEKEKYTYLKDVTATNHTKIYETYGPYTYLWWVSEIKSLTDQTLSFEYETKGDIIDTIKQSRKLISHSYTTLEYTATTSTDQGWLNPRTPLSSNIYLGDYLNFTNGDTTPYDYDEYSTTISPKYISRIIFPSGKVVFNQPTVFRRDAPGLKYLKDIQIVNNLGETIKSFVPEYEYFKVNGDNDPDPKNYRLYLKSLNIKNSTTTDNKYLFEYNTTYNLPNRNSVRQDYFGYFNNNQSATLVPTIIMQGQQYTYGDRSFDEDRMQANMLKKVYYPTGGYSEFVYKKNSIGLYSGTPYDVGGLRVEEVKDFDGSSTTSTKYIYQNGTPVSILYNPSFNFFSKELISTKYLKPGNSNIEMVEERNLVILKSNPVSPFYTTKGGYIGYGRVDVLREGNGKTVYEFTSPYTNPDLLSERLVIPTNQVLTNTSLPDFKHISKEGQRGLLLSKKIYNEATTLVKEETNQYDFNFGGSQPKIWGMSNASIPNQSQQEPIKERMVNIADLYYHEPDRNVLTENKITDYTPQGNFVKKRNFLYKMNKLVKEVSSSDSKGYLSTIFYRYADELNAVGQEPHYTYALMNSVNLMQPVEVVETKTINGSNYVVGAELIRFGLKYNPTKNKYFILPISQSYFHSSAPVLKSSFQSFSAYTDPNEQEDFEFIDPSMRLRTSFEYDVNSNLTGVKGAAGNSTAYLWGYKEQHPISDANNAVRNEIYQQNFEEPELGLDFEANVVNDNAQVHTGKYSGRIINPNATEFVSHSSKRLTISLTAPKKFTYSGWVYSNGPSAQLFLFMMKAGETGYNSYFDAVQTTAINKWVYVKKEFLVPADVVQLFLRLDNNAAGTVWFDDLRIQPSDAAMSTYTYEPLVGMTSAIDDSGRTVYYEYDTFQRLMNIKDQNGFIIKNYDYHYKP